MVSKILRIATRKSPLALWQAQHVADALACRWPDLRIQLVPIVTSGDKFLKDKLLAVGGKGLFVKELEEAILNDKADLAVHSMKDVPHTFPAGLTITAIGCRENPYDAFVSQSYQSLASLPDEAVIGTASLRRQSQLLAIRPDLKFISLRGNIQTRLSKLDAHEFDAIILATAGLHRMGLNQYITEIISEDVMLPACGQGALGIECREDDDALRHLITPFNDVKTALCVNAERRVNKLLGGNCHVPLAVYCQWTNDTDILLRAKVASADGKTVIVDSQLGAADLAMQLADDCAHELLTKGATELLHNNLT